MTKRGKKILSTADPLGNVVIMTDTTWRHTAKHGMSGRLADVKSAIETPETIKESTKQFPAFGFERKSTSGDEVRVVVAYETPNLFTGAETGYVSTAYPIYPTVNSAIGKIVWTKQTGWITEQERKEGGE